MDFALVKPGGFEMGSREGGEFDERPVHKVEISEPFFMATTEVTNFQYEMFDPDHADLRGRRQPVQSNARGQPQHGA